MAIKHIARQYDYIGLSTDDKTSITTEGATIYYVDKGKSQVYHNGSWHDKFESVETIGNVEDLVFHDESATPNAGLEFEVGNYKDLRIAIEGTATSSQVMFRGQLGGVNAPLLGIKIDSIETANSTTGLDEVWEFDISNFDKIWFGLPTVSGGTVTITGRVSK